mmetsp:Transcript_51270/g.70411  ORF Transcript_51270/g.70411 Transcript_51270/m.70411 type:complete len:242 (+) Transcript_51270:34-759(+)
MDYMELEHAPAACVRGSQALHLFLTAVFFDTQRREGALRPDSIQRRLSPRKRFRWWSGRRFSTRRNSSSLRRSRCPLRYLKARMPDRFISETTSRAKFSRPCRIILTRLPCFREPFEISLDAFSTIADAFFALITTRSRTTFCLSAFLYLIRWSWISGMMSFGWFQSCCRWMSAVICEGTMPGVGAPASASALGCPMARREVLRAVDRRVAKAKRAGAATAKAACAAVPAEVLLRLLPAAR